MNKKWFVLVLVVIMIFEAVGCSSPTKLTPPVPQQFQVSKTPVSFYLGENSQIWSFTSGYQLTEDDLKMTLAAGGVFIVADLADPLPLELVAVVVIASVVSIYVYQHPEVVDETIQLASDQLAKNELMPLLLGGIPLAITTAHYGKLLVSKQRSRFGGCNYLLDFLNIQEYYMHEPCSNQGEKNIIKRFINEILNGKNEKFWDMLKSDLLKDLESYYPGGWK